MYNIIKKTSPALKKLYIEFIYKHVNNNNKVTATW